jgi:hypothetical protein
LIGTTSKQCHLSVHQKCQKSWETWANIAKKDQCQAIFCRVNHPIYQTWFAKHRQTVEEHKREASLEATNKKLKINTEVTVNKRKSRSDNKSTEGRTVLASTGGPKRASLAPSENKQKSSMSEQSHQ